MLFETRRFTALDNASVVLGLSVKQSFLQRHHARACVVKDDVDGTEALMKGHRVVWKIEICYLIRMT